MPVQPQRKATIMVITTKRERDGEGEGDGKRAWGVEVNVGF